MLDTFENIFWPFLDFLLRAAQFIGSCIDWLAVLFLLWLVFAVLYVFYNESLISDLLGQGSSLPCRLSVNSAVSFVLVAMQTLLHFIWPHLSILGASTMLLGFLHFSVF